MITKDNIKKLLSALRFEQENDIFTKFYEGVERPLKVDVRKEHFHYKDIGITVDRETTSNFSEPENFLPEPGRICGTRSSEDGETGRAFQRV